MLLLLNKDTGMDGGSGDVECEGMSIDGDESEDTGIVVDVDECKEGIVVGDECKDGTEIGDAECEDTDIGTVKGLGVDYEVIQLDSGQLTYLEILTTDDGRELSKEGSVDIDNADSVCNPGSCGSSRSTSGSASKSSNCRERESNTEEFKDD
jgi:hypothetical protein